MTEPEDKATVISVALSGPVVKTVLVDETAGSRKVYWADGDRLALNGTASDALSGVGAACASAAFRFVGSFTTPYHLLYPASAWKDATTVTLPAVQTWRQGSFDPSAALLAGYMASASDPASVQHLCTIVQLSVRKKAGVDASNLRAVRFSGNADEQVSGDFTIDYTVPSLAPKSGSKELSIALDQPLSESEPLDLFLMVPAQSYASGFTVVLEDEFSCTMTLRTGAITLTPGKLFKGAAFTFSPSSLAADFTLADIEEEVMAADGYNVTGRVIDSDGGKGLANVVVTDGLQCVRTQSDGSFYMTSNLSGTKFIYVSTPSAYKPAVTGGIPCFYKLLSSGNLAGGIYDMGDFVLTPVSNPDHFTVLVTADPQPRTSGWTYDKLAFHSLDICEDLYQELADASSSIAGREVFGVCVGDLVHENMSLYANYAQGLAGLNYPTYNVIGNHDNNPSAADDDAAAETFESYFGPRNYSFNRGGIHFVVLDNLIMKDNGEGKLTAYDQGLTDEIWAWLQADLRYVPVSSKLMVFAHSPMFKLENGNERTNSARHGADYGDLINDYSEVHAWAGHTHVGFNYVYPSSHRHKRVQVHTVARSTGELWTNEYLAFGTPRGFTVVNVDEGEVSWKFHPTKYQRPAWIGADTGYCTVQPSYVWRDWTYNASGVAVMKDGSGALDERYQLHAYPRGAYGDDYVYANVFLWDDKWSAPVFTPTGGSPVTMVKVESADRHDLASTEFKTVYKTYANKPGGSLHDDDGYEASYTGFITTLFRAPAAASPASGVVSVTDRFGNVYTRPVSW